MLDPNVLLREIRKITDETVDGHSWPTSAAEAASRWATAVDTYAARVFPAPQPAAQIAAKEAFRATYAAQLVLGSPDALNVALGAYTKALALGMLPAFAAVAPVAPLDLSGVSFLGLGGGSAEACAGMLAILVHLWFLTGTAVNTTTNLPVTWL
jgi:hypothetical protein